MAKLVIFSVSAIWDDEAFVWSGLCEEILAAAFPPRWTVCWKGLSRMALDLAPDNFPDVEPGSIYIQINALREAIPAAA